MNSKDKENITKRIDQLEDELAKLSSHKETTTKIIYYMSGAIHGSIIYYFITNYPNINWLFFLTVAFLSGLIVGIIKTIYAFIKAFFKLA